MTCPRSFGSNEWQPPDCADGVGFLLLPSSLSLPGCSWRRWPRERGPCLPQSGSRRNCRPAQLWVLSASAGGGELPALGAHRGRKRKQSRASRAEQAEQSDRQGLGVGGHGARGGRGTAWSCVHSASPGVPRRRLSCRLWSFLLCREVGRRSEPHHTPAAIRYVLMPGCPV